VPPFLLILYYMKPQMISYIAIGDVITQKVFG